MSIYYCQYLALFTYTREDTPGRLLLLHRLTAPEVQEKADVLAQLVEDLEQLGTDEAAKEERLQAGSLQLRQLLAASSQPPRTVGSQQGQGGSQVLVAALPSPTKYCCANISLGPFGWVYAQPTSPTHKPPNLL